MGTPRPLVREGLGEGSMCGGPSKGVALRRDWLGLTWHSWTRWLQPRGDVGDVPGRKCELTGGPSRKEGEGHPGGKLVDSSARGFC